MSLNGAAAGRFYVASNPEFLREGSAVTDFLYPDRIVLGVDDDFSAAMLYSIYRPLAEGTYYQQEDAIPLRGGDQQGRAFIVTNAKSAELIKHASNAFLAMKISFINMVANISEAVGADIDQVCAGLGSDPRIGQAVPAGRHWIRRLLFPEGRVCISFRRGTVWESIFHCSVR